MAPMALGFVGAALSGAMAGFGMVGGTAAALGSAVLGSVIGGVVGVGLYAVNMLLAGSGQSNTTSPSGVSFTDTGLRFDPTPNFTSSQQVIPLVFGKTSIQPQIAHKRVYYTNYERGYYFLACGEGPLDLEKILIDDVDMQDLGNFSIEHGDPAKSWYRWFPLGSKFTVTLNNTGEFNWGASESRWFPFSIYETPAPSAPRGVITGPIVMIYGGGSITCKFKFSQDQADAGVRVRFKLENYYSPSDIRYSFGTFTVTKITGQSSLYWHTDDLESTWLGCILDSTVSVGGGSVDTTTVCDGEFTFTGLEELSTWRVTMEYLIMSAQTTYQNARVTFDKVLVTDTDKTEDFSCWGTAYAVVHLAWHETLSQTPQFSAIVKGFGRETGQDEGNPALCAYFLLTDREHPDSEPYDILVDRVDPLQVDWQSVQETMAFCNALKDGAGYRFNRAYGAAMEKEKALKEMMGAGRFFIFQLSNGTYFFKPDQDEPLTRVISESAEIVPGSLQYSINDIDAPNMIRCSYYDAGLGYTVQTLPIELPQEYPLLRHEALDLTGVTDQQQAYELGLYALLSRQILLYPVTLDVRYATVLSCYLGDLVQIDTSDRVLAGKTFRIMAIPGEKPGYIYTLQLAQHSPAIYTSKVGGVEEAGYRSFTPWYHIPLETSSPASFPGGNLGPSQIINLDMVSVSFYVTPSSLTKITVEYEYLPSNCEKVRIDYSLDNGQTWLTIGYPTTNSYTFDVDLRWGVLRVRVAAIYKNETGYFAEVQEYITGFGQDDTGIGRAQIGWSPIGGA